MTEQEKFSHAQLERFREAWGNIYDSDDPVDRLAMQQLVRQDREYEARMENARRDKEK